MAKIHKRLMAADNGKFWIHRGQEVTVGDIRALLEGVPDEAVVRGMYNRDYLVDEAWLFWDDGRPVKVRMQSEKDGVVTLNDMRNLLNAARNAELGPNAEFHIERGYGSGNEDWRFIEFTEGGE